MYFSARLRQGFVVGMTSVLLAGCGAGGPPLLGDSFGGSAATAVFDPNAQAKTMSVAGASKGVVSNANVTYDPETHVLSYTNGSQNTTMTLEQDGLRHIGSSDDGLYRAGVFTFFTFGELTESKLGKVQTYDDQGNITDITTFHMGKKTRTMPVNKSISYTGAFSGTDHDRATGNVLHLSGISSINVNLTSGVVDGQIDGIRQTPLGGVGSVGNTDYDILISGQVAGSQFSGSSSLVDSANHAVSYNGQAHTGTANGQFYGTDAQELGGNLLVNGPSKDVAGTFVTKD